ncbi:hypothetical protein ACGTN6_19675, partial [Halomonas sp. THAF12]
MIDRHVDGDIPIHRLLIVVAGSVAGRVGDRGGDADVGVAFGNRDLDADAVVQIVLGDLALVEDVAVLVGDRQGVAYLGTLFQGDVSGDGAVVADLVLAVGTVVAAAGQLDRDRGRHVVHRLLIVVAAGIAG